MIDPLDQLTQIEFDMGDAHNLSVSLLENLEEDDCDVGTGAIVCALSIGRLLSPKKLSMEEEIAFIQATLEFAATYFTSGVAN